MDGPLGFIASFLPICLVTALVCTATKETNPGRTALGTLRLFVSIVLGITAFCGVVYALTAVGCSSG